MPAHNLGVSGPSVKGHSTFFRVSSDPAVLDVRLFLQLLKAAHADVPIPMADSAASEVPFFMKFLRLPFMNFGSIIYDVIPGYQKLLENEGFIQIS
jgi:hypothetical protein